jgi:YHS domain-containing protein
MQLASSVFLASLALPFLLLAPSGAADDPAEPSAKIFCPVVGLPECKSCKCPNGYCSTTPKQSHTLSFEGGKLLFCCGQCKALFEKSPEKFAANARHQLVATGQARQQKCPLCGGEPKQEFTGKLAGVAIHFCSADCRDKLAKASEPEKLELLFGPQAFARGFVAVGIKK